MNLSSIYGAEGVESEYVKKEKRAHRFLKSKFRFIGLPFYNGIVLGRWEGLSEQRAHEVFMTEVISDINAIKMREQFSKEVLVKDSERWPNRHGRRVVNSYTLFMTNIDYNHPNNYIIQDVVYDASVRKHVPVTLNDIVYNPRFYIRFEQGIMGTYLIAQYWTTPNDPNHDEFNWTARSINYDKEATLGSTLNYLDRVCSLDTSQPDCPYASVYDHAIFKDRHEEFDWLEKAFSMSGFDYIEKLYNSKPTDMSIRAFYNACQENTSKHILERGVHTNQQYLILGTLINRRVLFQCPVYLRNQYLKRQHNKKRDRRIQKWFEKIMAHSQTGRDPIVKIQYKPDSKGENSCL